MPTSPEINTNYFTIVQMQKLSQSLACQFDGVACLIAEIEEEARKDYGEALTGIFSLKQTKLKLIFGFKSRSTCSGKQQQQQHNKCSISP
jgi:hypothetical protein